MGTRLRCAASAVCVVAVFSLYAGDAAPQSIIIDDFSYADDAAARAAWEPLPGVAPVSAAEIDGEKVLKLPCYFAGTAIDRGAWDRAVRLDLSRSTAIQFRFLCRNSLPIARFNFYLQSGDGWYRASFAPEFKGWNTITIRKEEMGTEGKPAGWRSIEKIRVAAWRGADQDAEFFISDLKASGTTAHILIVRGESAAQGEAGEMEGVQLYSRAVAACLSELGLSYTLVSDLELNADALKDMKLIVLPYNPRTPDAATDAMVKFVEGGGKALVFYTMPSKLAEALGIEAGSHVPAKPAGQFSSIRFAEGALAGAPPTVQQNSWNIREAQPVAGRCRTTATWFDKDGKSTGLPAVLASDSGVYMTHVLLAEDMGAKRRMVLAMLGHLLPDVWREAARAGIARIGRFSAYQTLAEAHAAIVKLPGVTPEATQCLQRAEAARADAETLAAAGKFMDAVSKAEEAASLVKEAYCLAQASAAGEHRGIWCHSAFGVQGMEWDEAVRRLAENGFTDLLPNMLWGGAAFYESSVLPVAAEAKQRGDQIAQCLAACHKYGIKCHVWKVCWRLGAAPEEFVARLQKEGRLQVPFSGSTKDHWLCPSHPDNQKLEVDSLCEVAEKYDVDGIHFDYIRYPNPDHCFCAGCRQRFEATLGEKVGNWPADVRKDQGLFQKWLQFRRDNITKVVTAVSEQVRKRKPQMKISAAVFSNWAVDRDSVGQDWRLWCEKGYLDFVCPMDYTPLNAEFEQQVEQQMRLAGKVPCYPGIGPTCWLPRGDGPRLVDKINIARNLKTGGFTIFEYSPLEAREVIPLLGRGITRK